MKIETQLRSLPVTTKSIYDLTTDEIVEATKRAEQRIAPLWPLRYFVAVNPYLGLIDHSFADVAQLLARRAGTRITAPRDFYAQAIKSGRITDTDLAAAIADEKLPSPAPASVAALKEFAFCFVASID